MPEDNQMDTSAEVVEEEDTSYSPNGEDNSEEAGSKEVKDTQEETQEPKTTEKGTKLDPDPQSALHQQLANERRARIELEEKLKVLAKQAQANQAQPQDQKPKQYIDPSKLNTKDELANVLNFAFSVIEKQNQQLQEYGGQIKGSQERQAEVANFQSFASEAQEVFKKFPELDEENKDYYNRALDEKLTSLYKKSAYDSNGRLLRNRPSFVEFATDFMTAVNSARQAGKGDAQTRIVQKQMGQSLKTSKGNSAQDLSNLSPEEFIAKQMGL